MRQLKENSIFSHRLHLTWFEWPKILEFEFPSKNVTNKSTLTQMSRLELANLGRVSLYLRKDCANKVQRGRKKNSEIQFYDGVIKVKQLFLRRIPFFMLPFVCVLAFRLFIHQKQKGYEMAFLYHSNKSSYYITHWVNAYTPDNY